MTRKDDISRRDALKRIGAVVGSALVVPSYWISVSVASPIRKSSKHSNAADAFTPPTIPVGLDAYRMWDHWPNQRLGARAYMRSTYDRTGGNEGADASHFLYMGRNQSANVVLDVIGKGVLCFVRTNHWHGSPWYYIVDGNDYIVKETGTVDPKHAKEKFATTSFIPQKAFPEPLAYTWTTTKGADLNWVPIGFKKSLRIAYRHTHYGTGYFIYKKYANENYLSKPIHSWQISDTPAADVLHLIRKSGADIAPKNIEKVTGSLELNQKTREIATLKTAPSVLRAFKLTLPINKAIELERVHLHVTWDGASQPSIDAPLSLFFGAGTLYNRDHREYLVKGFPINIRYDYKKRQVHMACYYPMPFFKSAKFVLTRIKPSNTKISYEIRYEAYHGSPAQSSYFHATYHDMPHPRMGKDLVLLDTQGVEGHQLWSGSFVGTSFIFSHNAFLRTLEGDPRFFFDNSQTPQAQGTGTEEWGGGGDYWGGKNMTLPFAGHPTGAPDKKEAKNKEDLIESAYRFLLADSMPFGRRAEIHLEHGGWNLSNEHYESVTYWYGLPSPSLVKTDELDIGRISSEKHHNYTSPDASKIEQITSRYERGIDTFPSEPPRGLKPSQIANYIKNYAGHEVYAAHRKDGRHTRGTSEFTIKVDPDNFGILIRRTLDYSFPNQKAAVYIADVSKGSNWTELKWKKVGIWYTAGSNTVVYSNPKEELGHREHEVETSNRRFRDDEFLLPANLTRGCSALRMRMKFIPVERDLYPGKPFPKKSAWSELDYQIYSYIMPRWPAHL